MFNNQRLELARKRRRYTARILSERSGISTITLSRIARGRQDPEPETVAALAKALAYPINFFFKDEMDVIDKDSASFRSLSSMTARERDAALSAASLAFEFSDWIKERFSLPQHDLPNLKSASTPTEAAQLLRHKWGIGEKPIGHFVKLLEAKGIRVFSLSEETKNVDAFSCWRNNEPFIFLNNQKSDAKSRWGVATVALAYRLNKLNRLSDWLFIQISKNYRQREPKPMAMEKSHVWNIIFQELWKEGYSRQKIKEELNFPFDEFSNLLFDLIDTDNSKKIHKKTPNLKIVE